MRRRFLVLLLLVGFVWVAFFSSLASAADEERPGGTTGNAFVYNKYIWTGDTSRYGQLEVQYHIDVQPNAAVNARWECSTKNGPLDTMSGGFSGYSRDVTGSNMNGAAIVLNDNDNYCAYHVWSTGGGFRITTSTVLFWLHEFVGGGGTRPSPAPGETAGPGSSVGPTTPPSPTPPTPDATLTCTVIGAVNASNCWGGSVTFVNNGMYEYTATSSNAGLRNGTTCDIRMVNGETSTTGITNPPEITGPDLWGGLTGTAAECGPPDGPTGWTKSGTFNWTAATTTAYLWGHRNNASGPCSTAAEGCINHTFTITFRQIGADGSASPSPAPTASPTAAYSAGTCEAGFEWSGTNCEYVPPPPNGGGGPGHYFPTLPPPPQGPGEPGEGLDGGGGMHNPNKTGIAECDADDGTYSKVGQAPLQSLPDTTFPGSINPMDYLPWVGNLIRSIPIAISNIAQTGINTGIDFVVPGECLGAILTTRQEELMLVGPFPMFTEVQAEVTAAMAGGGSTPAFCIPLIDGSEVCLPVATWAAAMGTWRELFAAAVWVAVGVGVLNVFYGSFRVVRAAAAVAARENQ